MIFSMTCVVKINLCGFCYSVRSRAVSFRKLFVVTEVSDLKVPKREIFDSSNFPDFYAIKSSWVCDLVVKISTYYFNF